MIDVSIPHHDVVLAASVYGDADAPPVLLLHGIGNARDTWFDWAMQLAPLYRVLALDFRGHGHSSRAARYHLDDYVSDAAAALDWLNAPTRVVGHSLGGTVAGRLAQRGHPWCARAMLVDPAWYFGIAEEFARTVYPLRFAMLQGLLARLAARPTTLADWCDALGQAPHPWGGMFADHTPPRLIAAHASALQRQDPACWQAGVAHAFGGFDPLAPWHCPTTVLHADPRYGAALLPDQAARLATANPTARVLYYDGSDHFPHRSYRFAARFGEDLHTFLSEATP